MFPAFWVGRDDPRHHPELVFLGLHRDAGAVGLHRHQIRCHQIALFHDVDLHGGHAALPCGCHHGLGVGLRFQSPSRIGPGQIIIENSVSMSLHNGAFGVIITSVRLYKSCGIVRPTFIDESLTLQLKICMRHRCEFMWNICVYYSTSKRTMGADGEQLFCRREPFCRALTPF